MFVFLLSNFDSILFLVCCLHFNTTWYFYFRLSSRLRLWYIYVWFSKTNMASHVLYHGPVGNLPRTPNKTKAQTKQRKNGFIHRAIMLLVSGFLIWASVAIAGINPAVADSPIPEIRSGIAGYCLNALNIKPKQTSLVDATLCNGKDNQAFSVSNTSIKTANNYCLALAKNELVLAACTNNTNQEWSPQGVGFVSIDNGQCLSLNKDNPALPLVTANCSQLDSLSESWTPSFWSGQPIISTSNPSCNQTQPGERVACIAEREWLAWQTDPRLHPTLLYDYTDGNPSEEWCADFVSYVYKQAGLAFNNGERGIGNWDEYNANNIVNQGVFTYHSANSGYLPKPGDVAYFNYSSGHVELVVSGGQHPIFVYGDSGTIDPVTGNGDMAENQITNDGSTGQLQYYLSIAN